MKFKINLLCFFLASFFSWWTLRFKPNVFKRICKTCLLNFHIYFVYSFESLIGFISLEYVFNQCYIEWSLKCFTFWVRSFHSIIHSLNKNGIERQVKGTEKKMNKLKTRKNPFHTRMLFACSLQLSPKTVMKTDSGIWIQIYSV